MDDKIKALREEITARMIGALEKGTAPWQKPWTAEDAPRNAVTGRRYNGVNALYLGFLGMAKFGGNDPRWLTFAQAKEKGWHVKKGEHGARVIFWGDCVKPVEDKDGKPILDKDGNPKMKTVTVAKVFTVFHASQVEGIPAYIAPEGDKIASIEVAERIMADSGADIRYGGNRAFFSPDDDFIALPRRELFGNAANFYATALHELAHWTGHKSRLARDLSGSKGTAKYAREELIAEMTAVFLSIETGIPQTPEHFENHAAYVASWVHLLKSEPDALFKAASAASKAAEYLLKAERAREAQKDGEAAA